jgi:hypothetical protein
MRLERIEVTTRDDYRGSQEPVAFRWRGRTYQVTEVLDRWFDGRIDSTRIPLRYFRVLTNTGWRCLIRHHELFSVWALCVSDPPGE